MGRLSWKISTDNLITSKNLSQTEKVGKYLRNSSTKPQGVSGSFNL
jgi:hypothetical protein